MYAQIVKFKLKADSSRELFIELAGEMVSWFRGRRGFVAYELYEGDEFWTDRIVWEDKIYAEEGLEAFLSTAMAKRLLGMIEGDFSSFFGQVVVAT